MALNILTNTNYFNLNAGTLKTNLTMNSTSTSTGSLVVSGGCGISSDLIVGGNIVSSNLVYSQATTYFAQIYGPWTTGLASSLVRCAVTGLIGTIQFIGSGLTGTVVNTQNYFTFSNNLPSGYYNNAYDVICPIVVLNNSVEVMANLTINHLNGVITVTLLTNNFSGTSGLNQSGLVISYPMI